MKDWKTLEPDVVRLMNKHYNAGRGGNKIEFVVIHHNAGVLTIDQIWQVWQTRAASAHYQVEVGGRIGQLVWDRDTAWHAANASVNRRSIGIEFSNSAGSGAGWPIADKTVEEGAHLVAAVCWFYKLGRPVSGRNVRFHREFTSTSCPLHLAPGGKYHGRLMDRAGYWFDQMSGLGGSGTGSSGGGSSLSDEGKRIGDIRQQLTGSRESGYSGFPQIDDRTLVDAIAAIGAHLELPGFFDPHGGSLREKNGGTK